ncbi:MAG: TonB-dependent receptor domain-containing protein [Burkholderiales bacterium]
MRRRKALFTFLLLTHCLWPGGLALAQSATASLSGTVEDEKGAVIAGAGVLAINLSTDARRPAKTGADGGFAIPLLPPSTYLLRVERAGFAPAEVRGVVLNVNDQVALRIQLKVGRVGETVNVTEGASLVDKSPAVGTVVNRQFVANLPLNGRSFNALINLTPGVVATPSSFLEQGQFSVNGQRPDANYFTVDGVSANIGISVAANLVQTASGSIPATSALGGTNNLVSVDALQEFRIQTSSYAPEFGRSPGAQVQLVTRSGTNDFHATIFEYFGHDALDAGDYFANRRHLPKPDNRLHDFGGVLGGPVIKNKTFIFSSFEGLRLQQPRVGVTTVPSLATRRSAAPGLGPVLAAFPLPNGAEVGNGLAEFSASFSDPSSLDAISLRADHNPSARLTLFGRYNNAPSENVRRGASVGLSTVSSFRVRTQTLTSGGTWAGSANHSNEFRFNYSLTEGRSALTLDDFGGAVAPPEALFFPAPLSAKDGLVIVQFLDSPVFSLGSNGANRQRQINVVDNHSLAPGAHSLKFGVDYRRLSPTLGTRAYDQFALFNDLDAVRTGTASVAAIGAHENIALFFTNFSAYGQDTWKLGRRLTLTYGLRWDANPPPSGKAGREPFAVTGFDDFATLALAPRGTALYETTWRNFAPRIGLAYQLSRRRGRETVLRGGFGIFYDLGTSSAGTLTASGVFPYGATRFLASVAYPLSSALAARRRSAIFRRFPRPRSSTRGSNCRACISGISPSHSRLALSARSRLRMSPPPAGVCCNWDLPRLSIPLSPAPRLLSATGPPRIITRSSCSLSKGSQPASRRWSPTPGRIRLTPPRPTSEPRISGSSIRASTGDRPTSTSATPSMPPSPGTFRLQRPASLAASSCATGW